MGGGFRGGLSELDVLSCSFPTIPNGAEGATDVVIDIVDVAKIDRATDYVGPGVAGILGSLFGGAAMRRLIRQRRTVHVRYRGQIRRCVRPQSCRARDPRYRVVGPRRRLHCLARHLLSNSKNTPIKSC